MISSTFPLAFIIYAGAIAAAMLVLAGVLYPRPTAINKIFFEYHRPRQIKIAIMVWIVLMVVVFLAVQWLRIPFFMYAIGLLSHPGVLAHDKFAAFHAAGLFVLIASEIIVLIHWFTYLIYSWIGATKYRIPPALPLSSNPPEVMLFICCCNEDPEILQRSVSTVVKLDYPNLRSYLVENSRNPESKATAVAVAERYGLEVLHVPNRGHKAGAMNDAMKIVRGNAKYLAVIDVDHVIRPEFVRELIPLLERDEQAAFVQTPQLYQNAEQNSTTRAAAMQEMLLYDSILESKGAYGRAMCCGSNFIVRISALDDVGGWDETTVSEDLCTSYHMHVNGWTSIYQRKAYAIGIGPATLSNYWKQQKRWAIGNTSVAVKILKDMVTRKPRKAGRIVRFEYLWSAGYYITTMALAAMATVPMLMTVLVKFAVGGTEWYAATHTRPLEWVYLSVYPLYAVVMLFPYVHMRMRGYRIRNLMLLQGLLANTIVIYAGSVIKGLTKGSSFFEIAPKSGSQIGKKLLKTPQTYIFAVLLILGASIVDMVLNANPAPFVWILLFWTFFYTLSFAHYFVFAADSLKIKGDEFYPADVAPPFSIETPPFHAAKAGSEA